MFTTTRIICLNVLVVFCTIQSGATNYDEEENEVFSPSETVATVPPLELLNSSFVRLSQELSFLNKRVESLEQSTWTLSRDNVRWVICSKGPCTCSAEGVAVNCWRRSFETIPKKQTVPFDTAFLDVGSNFIQSINQHTFKGLARLVHLDLSNNRVNYLPDNVFEDLESLKYLILQRNRLQNLSSGTFESLGNLETLDLTENELSSPLPPKLWSPCASLKILLLSHNGLTAWENFGGLRLSLQELDLTGNRLRSLESLKALKKLTTLKLGSNELMTLGNTTFSGLRSLVQLTLSQNKIDTIAPGTFKDLVTLEKLDLNDNRLTNISRHSFEGLLAVKELVLSRNSLSTIGSHCFAEMPTLTILSLYGNNLEYLDRDAFVGLSRLKSISLGNNMLGVIEPETLKPLKTLENLDLGNNELQFLPGELFEDMKELKTVRLASNAWNCTCEIMYLASWVQDHSSLIVGDDALCRSPEESEGKSLESLSFRELCD